MRIISGSHKGRAFYPPKNLPVRPTTDFGKEALFNVLNNRMAFVGIRALDLFSGTGNISYELASRGCDDITAVDLNYNCSSFIKKTAEEFGFSGLRAVKSDVFKFLKYPSGTYDLVFADPPYDMKETREIPDLIFGGNFLKPEGLLILEHSDELNFEGAAHFLEHRNYSKVNFSIFRK